MTRIKPDRMGAGRLPSGDGRISGPKAPIVSRQLHRASGVAEAGHV